VFRLFTRSSSCATPIIARVQQNDCRSCELKYTVLLLKLVLYDVHCYSMRADCTEACAVIVLEDTLRQLYTAPSYC
jgi:hypothetical protein